MALSEARGHATAHHTEGRPYLSLGIELAIDFVIMYLVMYTMIATLDHFYLNINNAYMTLMMVSPMAIVMLIAMRSMFPSRAANVLIVTAAIAVFVIGLYGMRLQAAVGDRQFVRSMIPHHSGAILMCRQAKLSDPELVGLCREIVGAQEKEIAQMKAILGRLP